MLKKYINFKINNEKSGFSFSFFNSKGITNKNKLTGVILWKKTNGVIAEYTSHIRDYDYETVCGASGVPYGI